jgi:hypothetical protein
MGGNAGFVPEMVAVDRTARRRRPLELRENDAPDIIVRHGG